jgi:hypothetical protein
MRTCPDCRSLVSVPLDACPARRQSCPLLGVGEEDPSEAVTDPGDGDPGMALGMDLRTARIDRQQIEAALASAGLSRTAGKTAARAAQPAAGATSVSSAAGASPRSLDPLVTQPAVVLPSARGRDGAVNQPTVWANRLAYWSILPLFPIGFTAVALALIGLSRGGRHAPGNGTEGAWPALVTGLLFGSTWLAVTLWLLAELR